jgi:hypothetical protein
MCKFSTNVLFILELLTNVHKYDDNIYNTHV